jgi:hypothetical protein
MGLPCNGSRTDFSTCVPHNSPLLTVKILYTCKNNTAYLSAVKECLPNPDEQCNHHNSSTTGRMGWQGLRVQYYKTAVYREVICIWAVNKL